MRDDTGTIFMDIHIQNNCYMTRVNKTLYIINAKIAKFDKDIVRNIITKIENKDSSVKKLSYNGNNINYKVDGILINSKPMDNSMYGLKQKEYVLVRETSEMYRVMERYMMPCAPRWISNILDGKATGEVIYKETSDYFIMPDFKWDYEPKHLYLLILFKNCELHSLRNITAKHIPLLLKAREEVMYYIYDKYNIHEDKLRIYFHYQPSAWQLHLHVQHIDSPIDISCQSSKAITLTDVIQNLKMCSDYYNKATLECIISTTDRTKYYK